MNDTKYGNSVVQDFNSNSDDNNDNNMLNDVDDFFEASYFYDKNTHQGTFALIPKQAQGLYSISIVDHGTNFPGVVGINRFFSGTNSNTIGINQNFTQNFVPTQSQSWATTKLQTR